MITYVQMFTVALAEKFEYNLPAMAVPMLLLVGAMMIVVVGIVMMTDAVVLAGKRFSPITSQHEGIPNMMNVMIEVINNCMECIYIPFLAHCTLEYLLVWGCSVQFVRPGLTVLF
jgi:hypothetical protein